MAAALSLVSTLAADRLPVTRDDARPLAGMQDEE